jgi:hypothetical protein
MPANYSPMLNDEMLEQILAVTEATPGAGGAPTYRLYGQVAIQSNRPLIRKMQYRNSYDGHRSPRRGIWEHSGTYTADDLTFEDFAILPRYGVIASPTPVDDGATTHGYTRTYIPSSAKYDTQAIEYGFNGAVMVATGIRHDDFTISHNIDDADGSWKYSSNLFIRDNHLKAKETHTATSGSTTTAVDSGATYVAHALIGQYVAFRSGTAGNIDEIRQITENTTTSITFEALPSAVAAADTFDILAAFTGSIAERDVEYIPNEGTKLFIADAYASIASNEYKDKMIAFSVQQTNKTVKKRFSNNIGGYSKKTGRGMRDVVVQITMEFDDPKEREIFETQILPKARAIRFEQTGSTIDTGTATKKLAQINLPSVYWDSVDTNQKRESNKIGVYQGLAYADGDAVSFGGVVGYVSKTKLATLP